MKDDEYKKPKTVPYIPEEEAHMSRWVLEKGI